MPQRHNRSILLSSYSAKIAEALNKKIYSATGHMFSGHTLKHLLSGVATFYGTIVLLRRRRAFG